MTLNVMLHKYAHHDSLSISDSIEYAVWCMFTCVMAYLRMIAVYVINYVLVVHFVWWWKSRLERILECRSSVIVPSFSNPRVCRNIVLQTFVFMPFKCGREYDTGLFLSFAKTPNPAPFHWEEIYMTIKPISTFPKRKCPVVTIDTLPFIFRECVDTFLRHE